MAEAKEGQRRAAVRASPVVERAIFTDRELRLIENCKDYAGSDPAGLPAHNLLLIVDKLDNLVGQLIKGRGEAELIEIIHRLG